MDTLEQLQQRLETLGELGSIVRTMQALAAAEIRQYELAVHSLEDYYRTVELGLQAVLRDMPAPARSRPRSAKTGALVFGSDHGLCGRFNEDMADFAVERLAEAAGGGVPPRLVVVGARMAALLEGRGPVIEENMYLPGAASRITATVRDILATLDRWRQTQGLERVYVFHNRPVPAGRFQPAGVQLLPVGLHRFRRLEAAPWPSRSLPWRTMDRDVLLEQLLQQYIFVTIFRACAESLAAENASRLAAMQSAEKNLRERRDELLGEFRRQRQDAITAELLDVVSGFEALSTVDP